MTEWDPASFTAWLHATRQHRTNLHTHFTQQFAADYDTPLTRAEKEAVRRRAEAAAKWQLHNTPDFDGVTNPGYHDPIFGVKPDPTARLVAWLETQHWSQFAKSLVTQYRETGTLTDRQIAAAESMKRKVTR